MNETITLTVMTVDIRNFTYHSGRSDKRLVTQKDFEDKFAIVCEVVRKFHEMTIDAVKRFDKAGTAIVLSAGDGLIVAFRTSDHANAALMCASALNKSYTKLFKEANESILERRPATALDFGIGIHTGEAILKEYTDYENPELKRTLVLGEAVNISTRIEELTKEHPEGHILFSEVTHKLINTKKIKNEIIDFHIHGIRGYWPLHIYGLLE